MALTLDQLKIIMPRSGKRAELFVLYLDQAMIEFGIDTPKRMVTFRGPRETLRTVKVQDPNIDLASIKQGQMAKIVVREVVAITVKSPNAGGFSAGA